MPNETRATRYHRARLQAGAGAFLASLLVLLAVRAPGRSARRWPALLHRLVGGWPWRRLGGDRGCSRPSSSSRARGALSLRSPSRVDAGRPLRPGAAVGRTLARTHLRGIAARITLGIGGGAARGRDLALVRRAMVARHRRSPATWRISPGRWRRRCCSAAFGGLRRGAPAVAGGAARRAGAALRRPRRGARMARRRRDARRRTRRSPASAGPARSCSRTRSSTRCATRRSKWSSRTRSGTTSTATCGGRRPGGWSRCR